MTLKASSLAGDALGLGSETLDKLAGDLRIGVVRRSRFDQAHPGEQ